VIGKIEKVPLRQVWKHEALDFTTWMVDNIDVLNSVLDREFSNPEREKSAGSFNVDIVAEDESGGTVIIENQLEKSDHDHLGKVITYLVAMDAKTAIWIVSEPRPEHIASIGWLNEATATDFYLLKVEAIKIDDSKPAPLLTLIVGPSDEGKEIGRVKKELAERDQLRLKFWTGLLDRASKKTKLHSTISPNHYNWIGTGTGKSGLLYNYSITKHEGQVELYIDVGKGSEEENKAILDELIKQKNEIESIFGEPLDWQSLDGKRACRVCWRIDKGGYRNDEEEWPEIQDQMIDAMVRLDKALSPQIKRLK
jgi:hypothetical protein